MSISQIRSSLIVFINTLATVVVPVKLIYPNAWCKIRTYCCIIGYDPALCDSTFNIY